MARSSACPPWLYGPRQTGLSSARGSSPTPPGSLFESAACCSRAMRLRGRCGGAAQKGRPHERMLRPSPAALQEGARRRPAPTTHLSKNSRIPPGSVFADRSAACAGGNPRVCRAGFEETRELGHEASRIARISASGPVRSCGREAEGGGVPTRKPANPRPFQHSSFDFPANQLICWNADGSLPSIQGLPEPER